MNQQGADNIPDRGATDGPRLDRSAFSVTSLDAQDDDGAFWSTKTPEERMAALEYLRRMAYGPAALEPMRKVLEIGQLGDEETPKGSH